MKGRLNGWMVGGMYRIHFTDEFDVEIYEDALKETRELRKIEYFSNIWFENLSEPEWC